MAGHNDSVAGGYCHNHYCLIIIIIIIIIIHNCHYYLLWELKVIITLMLIVPLTEGDILPDISYQDEFVQVSNLIYLYYILCMCTEDTGTLHIYNPNEYHMYHNQICVSLSINEYICTYNIHKHNICIAKYLQKQMKNESNQGRKKNLSFGKYNSLTIILQSAQSLTFSQLHSPRCFHSFGKNRYIREKEIDF